MTDCERHEFQAKQVLDKISKQLNLEKLNYLFEEPIKQVLCDFSYVLPKVPDTDTLLDLTADFLTECFSTGFKFNFPLTYWQYEASHFLEKFYQGVHVNGLEAAVDDAFNDENGSIELFLSNLAASLYQALASDYKTFTYKTCIPCDWYIKRSIIQLITRQYSKFLTKELAEAPAWALVGVLPELIDLCLQTENTFEKTISSGRF